MAWRRLVMGLALVASISLKDTTGQVPLSKFYPYGSRYGDRLLEANDDAAVEISLSIDFPFFGSTYKKAFLSSNGLINFGTANSGWVPQPFPLKDIDCIATYWTDSNPGVGGSVFFKEITQPTQLASINDEVRERFVGFRSFSGVWALVVTFERVPAYGCSNEERFDCETMCNQTVTHQAILVSDGISSFTIFNFNDLQYTTGAGLCDYHAQVGFNARDGKRFMLVPSSNKAEIARVALGQSNARISGKWMFKTNDVDISSPGCARDGTFNLVVDPRKLLYFGSQKVFISGPCFDPSVRTIFIYFENTLVECSINAVSQAECIAPLLIKLGKIRISLTHNSARYDGFVVYADANDPTLVLNSSLDIFGQSDISSQYVLRWNPNTVGAGSQGNSNVMVQGYQIDVEVREDGSNRELAVNRLNLGSVPNSGRLEVNSAVNVPAQVLAYRNSFRKSLLTVAAVGSSVIGHAAEIITSNLKMSANAPQECRDWYASQPSREAINATVEQLSDRSPCPCRVPTTWNQTLGNFTADTICHPRYPKWCNLYHPGAKGCYKSTNNNDGKGRVQCCYNSNGTLIEGYPGGGTVSFANDLNSHTTSDKAYMACCNNFTENLCHLYYEKRPSVDCKKFPPVGEIIKVTSDPHFSSLDRVEYTFNPVGEFTYLTTPEVTIQIRMGQGIIAASVIKAVVVRGSQQSDVIQIELLANHVSLRINGQPVTLGFGLWSLNAITIDYKDATNIIIHTPAGLTLYVNHYVPWGILNLIATVPSIFKGRQRIGLVGNWDDNQANGFQLPNGTTIPANSNRIDIHHRFGIFWRTTSQTSLFAYPRGLSWSNFQDLNFVPTFATPPAFPQCGENVPCRFDTMATGDIDVGLLNIRMEREAERIKQVNAIIHGVCPQQITASNGRVTISTDAQGRWTRYSIQCNQDFILSGHQQVTCVKGIYEELGVCDSPLTLTRISTSTTTTQRTRETPQPDFTTTTQRPTGSSLTRSSTITPWVSITRITPPVSSTPSACTAPKPQTCESLAQLSCTTILEMLRCERYRPTK